MAAPATKIVGEDNVESPAADKVNSRGLVAEGDQIIIRKGHSLKVLQARRNRVVYVEKTKVKVDEIINHQYGTQFEVKDGRLFVKKPERLPEVVALSATDPPIGAYGSGSDNRNLLARDDNQRLRREDVINLRKSGVQGEELLGHLIENSSTFTMKTGFSQEKWIKKKQAKHVATITVLRLTSRLLAQLYYDKDPLRICYMRPDSLAQLLTYSGVRAGSRPLVVETCQGLVVGSVLERLGGHGYAVQFFVSDNPLKQRCALDDFAFTKEELKCCLRLYPLCNVRQLKSAGPERPAIAAASLDTCAEPGGKQPRLEAECAAEAQEGDGVQTSDKDIAGCDGKGQTLSEEAGQKKLLHWSAMAPEGDCAQADLNVPVDSKQQVASLPSWHGERVAVQGLLRDGNFDTLIVATRFHPTPIVMALLDLVAPSRPFAIYHQYLEPLTDCYQALRDRGGTVNLRLSETWLREQQVLPQRTHPMVTMNGSSGYLLTGITVIPDSAVSNSL